MVFIFFLFLFVYFIFGHDSSQAAGGSRVANTVLTVIPRGNR